MHSLPTKTTPFFSRDFHIQTFSKKRWSAKKLADQLKEARSKNINPDGGCAEVVSKLRAFTFMQLDEAISPSTGAYCKARGKLAVDELEKAFTHTAEVIVSQEQKILSGRRVLVVDGTGVTAADTKDNQEQWPQQESQKPGCG